MFLVFDVMLFFFSFLFFFFFLMIRRPPKSTRTDTLFPYTTLFRSDNNVDATVAIGETAAFGISYSNPNALDITVGNISADVGKLGEFDVRVTDEGGPGALVVGDIDVTGGISSEFSLTVSASGQVAGATHDVTVGNISRSEEHTSELQSLMR